jgi:hypothetical protein
MRSVFLLIATLSGCSQLSHAIYGPSLIRTDSVVSTLACRQANFTHETQITEAMQDENPTSILRSLRDALVELRETPTTSDFYPAGRFAFMN